LKHLYLNKQGIELITVASANSIITEGSIEVALSSKDIDPEKLSNLSILILPSINKSNKQHNSIVYQLYLSPYLRGIEEKTHQYFETLDKKTNYNLDLLMLTQDWSSYNWNRVFSGADQKLVNPFEKRSSVVVNAHKSHDYLTEFKEKIEMFPLDKDTQTFRVDNLFPYPKDSHLKSQLNKRDIQVINRASVWNRSGWKYSRSGGFVDYWIMPKNPENYIVLVGLCWRPVILVLLLFLSTRMKF
jgi:hypothetical protein